MSGGWRDGPSPQPLDVHFLDVEEVAGEDEVLPEPAPGAGLRARRAVWLLAAVVLAALVVTALVNRPASAPRAATTPRGRHVVAPTPIVGQLARGDGLVSDGSGGYVQVHDGIAIGPMPHVPGRTPPVLDLPRGFALIDYVARRDPCPIRVGCEIGTTPTPPVLAALHGALPRVHDIAAASTAMNDQLDLRVVRARVGTATVEVEVRPTDLGDAPRVGALRRAGGRVYYARIEELGFTVDAQASGHGVGPSLLEGLAEDRRLLR